MEEAKKRLISDVAESTQANKELTIENKSLVDTKSPLLDEVSRLKGTISKLEERLMTLHVSTEEEVSSVAAMPTDSGNSNSGGNNNLTDGDGGEHASIGDCENDAAIAKMLQDEWNNEDMPMHSSDDSDGDEDNSVDERKTSATRNLALAEDIEADVFSEGTEHEEDEVDDTTDKEIAQLPILDFYPGIINYDKSLELCCIGPCLCECATDKESCDEVQVST